MRFVSRTMDTAVVTAIESPLPYHLAFLEVPALDDTLGVFLIGTFLSLILYGINVHQAYRYFRLYPEDRTALRLFVACIIVAETLFTTSCMHTCYFYLIKKYFDPLGLLHGVWSLQVLPALTGFVIFLTQCFFARRVYLLRPQYRPLVAIAVFFSLVTLAETVKTYQVVAFEKFEHYTWIDCAGLAGAVVSDGLTTSMLLIILRQSRTGFKQTDHILDRLILYTVNTGLLTTFFNILAVVLVRSTWSHAMRLLDQPINVWVKALLFPGKLIYIAIVVVDTKVYSNSLLAVYVGFFNRRHKYQEALVSNAGIHTRRLNSRRSLTEGRATTCDDGISASVLGGSTLSNSRDGTARATAAGLWAGHNSVGSNTSIEVKATRVGPDPKVQTKSW
ncbi:hypothetical protein C8Q77DRAFT_1159588 [Trametes polyzona]|nr:hypothetical protein C8Q77DRAFT_1159588 [Trametes polyzona]